MHGLQCSIHPIEIELPWGFFDSRPSELAHADGIEAGLFHQLNVTIPIGLGPMLREVAGS
jgi:hypothetical protein